MTEYQKVISKLESLGVMPDRPPALDIMKEVLRLLGMETLEHFQELRKKGDRVIVVAGTNGKGSVCSTLEKLFQEEGEKVGLYTSPHLVSTTERIRVSGQNITESEFVEIYQIVRSKTKTLTLTHFEFLTAMAFWYFFATQKVDRAIFEVGLGGTWDATNAIPHRICLITSIGHDHEEFLGNTLEEIAKNKLGIVGPNSVVVHSPLPKEAQTILEEVKNEMNGKWFTTEPFETFVEQTHSGPHFYLKTKWGTAELSLPGERGAKNTILALTAFEKLGRDPTPHLGKLKDINWPGRMSQIKTTLTEAEVFFSGDHNPQGMESLVELIRSYTTRNIKIIFGCGKKKRYRDLISILKQGPGKELYLTVPGFMGKPIEEYDTDTLKLFRKKEADPWKLFCHLCKDSGRGDLILVTGSLYLVGDIMKNLPGPINPHSPQA